MKRLVLGLAVGAILSSSWSGAQVLPPVIPLPAVMEARNGPGYVLTADTAWVADASTGVESHDVLARLRRATGLPLPIKSSGANGIVWSLDPGLTGFLGNEGYQLESSPSGVKVVAAKPAGLFYASQTLLQLLPAQACSPQLAAGIRWEIPALRIIDRPRFAWRGFMLDEARQFFGKEHVKRLLDTMALYKLNRFHWHLSDDEGWRIEIKAYPKLTEIGAWRGSECLLPNPRKETNKRYGGFYTQADIRELVAYAKARHIEVMPELDMPGHGLAIVTSYPNLLPQGAGEGVSAQGFKGNAISPAKEETYQFIERVFDEIKPLFPFPYIHIGGDEVNHNAWKDCPQIKALMAREKLGNLHEVQGYFTRRLEKIFAARGIRIFGWNEILDDRLDRNTGIMAWIGTGPGYAAARKGFPVVMAPGPHAYFDMPYPGAQGEPPAHWWAGPVDTARVYAFDPLGDGGDLPQDAKDRILGVHSALWTEFVQPWKGDALELPTYSAHADYKTWPRLAALAEVGWTPQARRQYPDFEKRLGAETFRRLGLMGIFYRMPVPTATHRDGFLTIRPPFAGAHVHYTFDGSLPTLASPAATAPIPMDGRDPSKLRARTFFDGRASTLLVGATAVGAANWSPATLTAGKGTLEFELSKELNQPGSWQVTFAYTSGAHAAVISGIDLLVNGAVVATDPHHGRTGAQSSDNTWRFDVPNMPKPAKVTLRARIQGDGGNDSHGTVTVRRSPRP